MDPGADGWPKRENPKQPCPAAHCREGPALQMTVTMCMTAGEGRRVAVIISHVFEEDDHTIE